MKNADEEPRLFFLTLSRAVYYIPLFDSLEPYEAAKRYADQGIDGL